MNVKPSEAQGGLKKWKKELSADATALAGGVTVAAGDYGVVYKLWLDLDVSSEADLEALPDLLLLTITIGTTVFSLYVHPYVEHTDAHASAYIHRTVDLGPWYFDFGPDGIYSDTAGDNIVIAVEAAGNGVKSRVNYQYSGD